MRSRLCELRRCGRWASWGDKTLGQRRCRPWMMIMRLVGFGVDGPPCLLATAALAWSFSRRLSAGLLRRLGEEINLHYRDLIYTFPQEFGTVRSVVQRFLEYVFESSPYAEPFLWRGVYFYQRHASWQSYPTCGCYSPGFFRRRRPVSIVGVRGQTSLSQRGRQSVLVGAGRPTQQLQPWTSSGPPIHVARLGRRA